jgi:hypothetical protein
MAPVPNISFSCPGCGKKFTAPAAAAGKTVTCSCGTKVQVAAAIATPQPSPTPPSAGPHVAPAAIPSSSAAPSFTAWGPQSTPLIDQRRSFPALSTVAAVLMVIAWIYVVLGVLGGLGMLIAAANQGEPGSGALGIALLGCCALAFVIVLAVIFIRAAAEMIRLFLYMAELLEDIRAK